MMGLVSSDELATDVTGAEALLERHQVRDLGNPQYVCTEIEYFELGRVFCVQI